MNIEIIAIGNEVLSGFVVNANAAYISQELFKIGLIVNRHSVLPDDFTPLKQGLQEASLRSNLIICTGGLGSTCDDGTRQVAAELFESDFYLNEEVLAQLKARYGSRLFTTTLENQAMIPTKAKILKNEIGTASGLIFESSSSTLILLPGIPSEMKALMTHQVLPYLRKNLSFQQAIYSKTLHFFNLPESHVDIAIRDLQKQYPNIHFGIYPSSGILTIRLWACPFTLKDKENIESIYNQIKNAFIAHFFDSPSGKIEEAVHQLLQLKHQTLSIAESCTGGVLAMKFTKFPGASHYFLGSVVAYSNDLKMNILGVNKHSIETKGAVSEEVAAEMVDGVKNLTKSDYALAVSGIAGPTGGTNEKPVGTICAAIALPNRQLETWTFQAYGDRNKIMDFSANIILGKLWSIISKF